MKKEYRFLPELRASGDEFALVGYAATFNSESKDLGGFREVIAPSAFKRSLEGNADVKALFNHDANRILGRTTSGTLRLEQDEKGLKFKVELDPANSEDKNLYASVKRGDVNECSFAFTVVKGGQIWADKQIEGTDGRGVDDFYAMRTLTDVNLLDISAVTYPAYNDTNVNARMFEDVAECRSMAEGVHTAVAERLEEARKDSEKARRKAEAHAANDWDADGDVQDGDTEEMKAARLVYASEKITARQSYEGAKADAKKARKASYAAAEDVAHGAKVEAKQKAKAAGAAKADVKAAGKVAYKDALTAAYAKADNEYVVARGTAKEAHKQAKFTSKAKLHESIDGVKRSMEHDRLAAAAASQAAEAAAKAEQTAKEADAAREAAAALQALADTKRAEAMAYRLDNGLLDDEEYEDNVDVEPGDVWFEPTEDDAYRAAVLQAETRASGKVRTKRVGGKNLPKSAFAYVGDAERTETWKLPIHDAAHVRNALARFNQTKGIPAAAKTGVYSKIKRAAKKFGIKVSDEDSIRSIAWLADAPFDEDEILAIRAKAAGLSI